MKHCLLLLALFFTGCMVGPKYKKPEMNLPDQYEEASDKEASQADLREWWKQFNDPLLDSFIEEAIAANYDFRIALEKIEETRAQYRIDKSYLWPEIDFNAAASRTRISQNFLPNSPAKTAAGGTGVFPTYLNIFQVGLDAIWELDFFGKFRHNKNAAFFTWESTKDNAEAVLISMVSEVAVTYVNIRALQKKIELAQRKIQVDQEELQIIRELFQVGLDNELQVAALISTLESDRALLPPLETSFKQQVYALAYLLGREPEGVMDLFQEVKPIPQSSNRVPVGLPSDLLRRRPDIRSAERQLAAATEKIGSAVADLFPHLVLTGVNFGGSGTGSSIGFESGTARKLFESASRTFSIGVGLNWNLLDFGRVRGQIDVQNSLQRQALLTYEQTVISSLKDVESALVSYFEEEKRQHAFQIKEEADRRTLDITEGLLEIGLENALQVLNAKKALIDTESSLADSQQALAGDLIALYKAIGGSWVPEESQK